MRFFTIIILSILVNCSSGYSQTNLTIKLNKKLDPSKVMISYSDGTMFKYSAVKFTDHQVILRYPLQSKYAMLGIFYVNEDRSGQGTSFYLNEKKSSIQIDEVADSVDNKISNYKAKNLINFREGKVYNKLNRYAKNEFSQFKKVLDDYNKAPTSFNSKLYGEADERLKLKELEYIKSHGEEYFHFAKFIQEIVPSLRSNYLLELYEVFNTAFPAKFKDSYEGKVVKTLLEGNLFVKVGMQSPLFKTVDYTGSEISSENLKGKHYLLSFWATWCGPCLEEIPQLKRIRDLYTEEKLEMISISRDTDSIKFINGIDKYKMDWTHVFNRPKMGNLFGEKPIPSLYLIDKNGKIIFSSWELALPELEAILRRELN